MTEPMKVRDLLCDEGKWCKGANAVDANGDVVHPLSKHACRWCLLGAIIRCYGERPSCPGTPGNLPLKEIRKQLGPPTKVIPISTWNDARTTNFADIRRVLELADV